MRMMRMAFILVVAGALVLGAAHVMMAGRSGTEAPGEGLPIATDPSAKGMKLSGVLGAHYQRLDSVTCPEEKGPDVSMTFFLRLKVGKDLHPFGGVAPLVCYWEFGDQWSAVQNLVKTQVLPFLNQEGVIAIPDACFAFKEVSDAVDSLDDDWTDPLKPAFSLLNFVLAINDRTACP